MAQRIGFIGLGTMGLPMATRIAKGGYHLSVYNRTAATSVQLNESTVTRCASPADVARQSDVVFSMLSTPGVLHAVATGTDGILAGIKPGAIHVDCSTVSPEVTRELEASYKSRGATFMHMPVLGSVPQAEEGSLLLFVGGETVAFNKIEPLLSLIGKRHWHFAKIEQATIMKLICNSFIAGMIGVLAQAIVFARKAGLSPADLLEIIGMSQMNAPMYQSKGSSILARNFAPRFYTEHLDKDARLFVEAGRSLGVPMPVGEVMKDLFTKAMERDLAREDYSSVIKVLEQMAGL